MNSSTGKLFSWLIAIGVVLNITCLFNEILEPDGTLYAALSKQIALSNDWMNLFDNGHDWLDKPHLPFWLAALSMKCFGINAFAYKLPALLCSFIGAWYTYKLAVLLYNRLTAQLSVIIYLTALHTILANFDVRAEACLTGFVIAAIYHMYRAGDNKWLLHVVAAAFFSALAMMTKGIFVLVTIAAGFVIYWIVTKQWKQFISIRWWLLLVLSFVFIFPELYSLYVQFDAHPEKVMYGHDHVSGIRFFFWDSQFGRFFNNGPIKGKGDLSFFLHTLLWAFLPWSVLLYVAVVVLFNKKRKQAIEARHWIIWGSAGISFLMFSLSKFQLPHYIVILFPQMAMITAAYLLSVASPKAIKAINILQWVLLGILVALIMVLCWFSHFGNPLAVTIWVVCMLLVLLINTFRGTLNDIVMRNAGFSVMLFIFLNFQFYPSLMHYQAGMEAGKWIQQNGNGAQPVLYRNGTYSYEFYAPGQVEHADSTDALLALGKKYKKLVLFLPQSEMIALADSRFDVQVLHTFDYFHISQLTGKFLNPQTRQSQLDTFVLAAVSEK
ncbi:ArnT family glycosyltransferase [Deminuibacter soli]|uniref:Phospholipid carrier-dependent glycosyltransferase n=1 Tax=Deminuibacter soli TaxID=2291815 RepID=A0A3E1NFJ7_9BACT|nr:glycosyltransferase family 39 protein [Deminuibacter soli]RFM26739.1 phospholipid carrier-dependent glycosyltransferase [Deminuibacter soli]